MNSSIPGIKTGGGGGCKIPYWYTGTHTFQLYLMLSVYFLKVKILIEYLKILINSTHFRFLEMNGSTIPGIKTKGAFKIPYWCTRPHIF